MNVLYKDSSRLLSWIRDSVLVLLISYSYFWCMCYIAK